MNISANDIVSHIEEKVNALRQAVGRGDEEKAKECATEIAAYCKLLKGVKKETSATVLSSPTSSPTPISAPSPPSGEGLGNLLEF